MTQDARDGRLPTDRPDSSAPVRRRGLGDEPGYGAPPPAARGAGPRAPRPGIVPLRPLGLGEIYDGAFRAIRTNPGTMIGISAIVIAVTTLLSAGPQAAALSGLDDGALAAGADPTPGELAAPIATMISALFVPALVQSLAVTVLTGLLIVAVSGAVLGRRTPPGLLWRRTRRRIPGLIGIAVVTVLLPLTVSLVLAAPGVAVAAAGSTGLGVLLVVLGVLASLPIAVLLYIRWSMAAPAMLLEEQSLVASLRRSWRLVAGSTWRVLGILLLTTVMVTFLAGIISVPFSLAGGVAGAVATDAGTIGFAAVLFQVLLAGIGQIISGAILYPFTAAVTALLYIDLRMRREGLDVELIRVTQAGPTA